MTALEVSGVVLERAAGYAWDTGADIRWVHATLTDAVLPPASFDPADYVWPAMVTELLDDDWQVDEQRPRVAPDGGADAHHTDDLVMRVRRLR